MMTRQPTNQLHRFTTFILSAFIAILSPFGVNHARSADKRSVPNIVLILADDLGYSDLGCYGGEIETPNLNNLARNGVRFTQFYNTARCWPSRAALLTGYYAQQVRRDEVPGLPGGFDKKPGNRSGARGVRPAWAKLLPEMLRPVGYRAYHSGKWHVDGTPLKNGFDRSYWNDDQGKYFFPQRHYKDDEKLPAVKRDAGYYATRAIADHAIECLKEHAAKHADKPFFHYLAFTAPHFPLQALPEDIARYKGKYNKGWDAVRQERWRRQKEAGILHHELPALEREVGPPYVFPNLLERYGPGEVNRPIPWTELNKEQQAFQAAKMEIHAAMVDREDREIGRVLEQLRAMNAFDNTVILFLSDNGASAEMMIRDEGHDPKAAPGSARTHLCLGPGWSSTSNAPLRRHKTWVHEGGISTPLIVHWPKGIAAHGELRNNPGHLIDIVPTILELTGGKRPEKVGDQPVPTPPGKSLVPTFTKDGTVPHDFLWWCHEGNRALRVGDWKIVAAGAKSAWELYDLKTDRGESHNLADKQPDKLRELAKLWLERFDEYVALAKKDLPPEEKKPNK